MNVLLCMLVTSRVEVRLESLKFLSRIHVTMAEPKLHPILERPHEYEISDFRYHVEKEEPGDSFIEMTLQKNTDSVTLRFWQPIHLKIEHGFPRPTRGMVFYDRSPDGLESINVEVADFEASWGSITFCARSVELWHPHGERTF